MASTSRAAAASASWRVAHRRRAGMVRPALDDDLDAGDAGDGGDDADVEVLGLQHRALLDMEFEEGADVARGSR